MSDPDRLDPQATLRAVILLVLAERPRHGYELAVDLRSEPLASASISYLYRTLRTMEADGLTGSVWEGEYVGQARRIYHLTPHGRFELDDLARRVGSLAGYVGEFIARYQALPSDPTAHPTAPGGPQP